MVDCKISATLYIFWGAEISMSGLPMDEMVAFAVATI